MDLCGVVIENANVTAPSFAVHRAGGTGRNDDSLNVVNAAALCMLLGIVEVGSRGRHGEVGQCGLMRRLRLRMGDVGLRLLGPP